jgi:mannose-6-phosphate isomerase-like protein (cupin superfamily)
VNDKTAYPDIPVYTTKDGSQIRELMHPMHHGVRHQSLAEARVSPGATTRLHRHLASEELYHVTAGYGTIRLGEREFPLAPGDTVCIPPGTAHRVSADAGAELVILCSCAPAYRHEDTELLD